MITVGGMEQRWAEQYSGHEETEREGALCTLSLLRRKVPTHSVCCNVDEESVMSVHATRFGSRGSLWSAVLQFTITSFILSNIMDLLKPFLKLCTAVTL